VTWPGDAQTWMDVVDHLIVGLILIAAAAVPSVFSARNHRSISSVRDEMIRVRENVVNNHPRPMREDLDRLAAKVDDVADRIDTVADELTGLRDETRGGLTAIRGDLTEERATRRAGDQALRDEMHRRRSAPQQRPAS
jgi:vacuolar-type H+-ATPase subunit I/STV1